MRKLLIVVGVLILVIAVVIGFAMVNLNSYLESNKELLETQVEGALGRDVSFDEVSVSFSGGLGARLKNLRIADDPTYGKEPFVAASDVQIVVGIWPALRGKFEVRKILLAEPALVVIQGPDGFNFDSIGKSPDAESKSEVPEVSAPGDDAKSDEDGGVAAAAFLIAHTEIRDGALRYVDRTGKTDDEVVIRHFDFEASDVSLTSPIEFSMAVALFGVEEQNVRLSGTVGPLGDPVNVAQTALNLEAEVGPVVIDDLKKIKLFKGAIPPELSSADPISVSVGVQGTPEKLRVSSIFDAKSAGISFGNAFVKPSGTALALDIDATRVGERVEIAKLIFRLAELELSGKGSIETGTKTAYDLKVDSNRAPLAGWNILVPALEGHDVSGQVELHLHANGAVGGRAPKVNGTLHLESVNARLKDSPHEIEGLTTTVQIDGDRVTLPPTTFSLGGSPLEIEAKIATLASRKGTFALRSENLRAASLGMAGEAVTKDEAILGLDLSGAFDVPAGTAPRFNAKLRSTGGSLRDIDYDALAVDFVLRDQVATLDSLELEAFEGSYQGSGRYDMSDPAQPRFDFRSKVTDVNLKSLLASQMPGAEERIEGRLYADLTLAGAGKNWETIRDALTGDGQVDVKEGMLKDVNIAEQVFTGATGVPGLSNLISSRTRQKYPELFETGDTKFDKLGGTVVIGNGEVRTDDLELTARDYSILGEGSFFLVNRLDFTASLFASEALSSDLRSEVKEIQYITDGSGRVKIPFRMKGTLPRVKPKPDTQYLAAAIGRAVVEKGLGKLFGGGKQAPEDATGEDPVSEPTSEDLIRKGLESLF